MIMVIITQKIKLDFNNCDIYYLEHNNNFKKNNLKNEKDFLCNGCFCCY